MSILTHTKVFDKYIVLSVFYKSKCAHEIIVSVLLFGFAFSSAGFIPNGSSDPVWIFSSQVAQIKSVT